MELIPNPTDAGDTWWNQNFAIASGVPRGDSKHKSIEIGALNLEGRNSNPRNRNRT